MRTKQLPSTGEVFLDHVAHFVPDMSAAAAAMARCGFRLTPYAEQANTAPDGTRLPAGTANRCAMLRRGYIEILAATAAETALRRQLEAAVGHHVGLHLVAFSSADAESERDRLLAGGFAPLPPVRLRRETSAGEARFTVVRVPPGTMPEGRIQFVTHHTESVVWREADLEHPNGVVSLEEVAIVVEDLAEAAGRWARFTGLTPQAIAREQVLFAAQRGRVRLLDRASAACLAPVPAPPAICAVALGVDDIDRARHFLDDQGVGHSRLGARLAIPLPSSLGGLVVLGAQGTASVMA